MKYTQCKLKKGTIETVTFIPASLAKIGRNLQLKSKKCKETWDDGWKVAEVYETVDEKVIKDQQHNSGDIWKATSGSCPRGNK